MRQEIVKGLQHEYAGLRRQIYDRNRRLREAGYTGKTKEFAKVRDVAPEKLRNEIRKAERWLEGKNSKVSDVRRQERERAERKEREREERERQRPPRKTEEEKRLEHNRRERERYARRKAEREDIDKQLKRMSETDPKGAQALRNAMAGLAKFGVKIRSFEELKAWGAYLGKRAENSDVKKGVYSSDKYIDELLDEMGDAHNHVNADDLNALLNGFESFMGDMEAMQEAFSEMMDNADFGADMFETFMNS